MDNSTAFVIEQGKTSAQLKFRGGEATGIYALVPYGDEGVASSIYERVLPFKRIANCHPPLINHPHLLPFTMFPKTLGQLFADTDFLTHLESDTIKYLLKSVGLLGLQVYEKGLWVDLGLDNISCCTTNKFILIKCIALSPDDVAQFSNCKDKMIQFYEDVKKKLGDNKMFKEYNKLKEELDKSNTKQDFLSILQQSWIFWRTEKRMTVIYNLTGMLRKHGRKFTKYCDSSKLLNWRGMMSRNKDLSSMVQKFTSNEIRNRPDCMGYKITEVFLLLCFLRTCLGHFSTFQNKFKSEEKLVRYLDNAFLDIMAEVYQGCAKMEQAEEFNFGIL